MLRLMHNTKEVVLNIENYSIRHQALIAVHLLGCEEAECHTRDLHSGDLLGDLSHFWRLQRRFYLDIVMG